MLVLPKNDISAVVEYLFNPIILRVLCQHIYKSVTSSSESFFLSPIVLPQIYHIFVAEITLWQIKAHIIPSKSA